MGALSVEKEIETATRCLGLDASSKVAFLVELEVWIFLILYLPILVVDVTCPEI